MQNTILGDFGKSDPVLNPFITTGAYYGNYFDVRSDMFYGAGQEYHYWPNGIYDRSEDAPNSEDKARFREIMSTKPY